MRFILTAIFLVSLYPSRAIAQTEDCVETLLWVEQQASRVDTMLHNAVVSHDHTSIVFSLLDAYLIFDAVSVAGVYCATVREAAQEGRNQCDVVNYRLEKDLNTNLARATSARIQAERMRNGAKQCKAQLSPSTEAVFLPKDVIQKDAKIVLLDLEDGLASGSIHILAQKLEHAVQVMYDIQHLALTLADCREVYRASQQIVRACESALAARNWTEVKKGVNEAIERTKAIGALTCR